MDYLSYFLPIFALATLCAAWMGVSCWPSAWGPKTTLTRVGGVAEHVVAKSVKWARPGLNEKQLLLPGLSSHIHKA